jgi:hypothetical protein
MKRLLIALSCVVCAGASASLAGDSASILATGQSLPPMTECAPQAGSGSCGWPCSSVSMPTATGGCILCTTGAAFRGQPKEKDLYLPYGTKGAIVAPSMLAKAKAEGRLGPANKFTEAPTRR